MFPYHYNGDTGFFNFKLFSMWLLIGITVVVVVSIIIKVIVLYKAFQHGEDDDDYFE